MGRQPQVGGSTIQRDLHVAARAARGRGRGARTQRADRDGERQRLVRSHHQPTDAGAQVAPALQRAGLPPAGRSGERRTKGSQVGSACHLGVGSEEAVFNAHRQVLDGFSDAARYIGPIGAGSVAKLVHNCAGYGIQMVLAEVFSMGIKAGVEPLALWETVRTGASGR